MILITILFASARWLLVVGAVVLVCLLVRSVFKEDVKAEQNRMEALKQTLNDILKGSQGVVNFNEFLTLWGWYDVSGKTFPKRELDDLLYRLDNLGFGLVPNYEFGHKRLNYDEVCVLYRKARNVKPQRPEGVLQSEIFFKLLAVILGGETLTQADRDYVHKSMRLLNSHSEYYGYLYAYLLWLSQKKQIYDKKTKDEVSQLSASVKKKFANLLLDAVCAGGDIDNKRLDALKRILPTLGFDPGMIHSMLHQNLTDENGFVTIEQSESIIEYTIRQPGAPRENPVPAVTPVVAPIVEEVPLLDPARLAELRERTQVAQGLLSDIFVQEEEEQVPAEPVISDPLLEILEKLFEKEIWNRDEIQELAGPGVMIGNLLERINDYACSKIDDIVVEEDGDNIYVTTEYKEHLI